MWEDSWRELSWALQFTLISRQGVQISSEEGGDHNWYKLYQ
jgi:hypothetical protein